MKKFKVVIQDALGNKDTIIIRAENKRMALVNYMRDNPARKLFGTKMISIKETN